MLPTFPTAATTVTTIAGSVIALPASTAAPAVVATMAGRNIARFARSVQQPRIRTSSLPVARMVPRATATMAFHPYHYLQPTTMSTTAVAANTRRFLSTTPAFNKIDPAIAIPTEISEAHYHELADDYLESILVKFEELQDEGEDLDVDFSAGVMKLQFPFGTYVINKQPPNKQIWLSSPKSGPKRYDWVVVNEGQDSKADTGHAEWVYTRDGTTIQDLFIAETGIDLNMPIAHSGG